MNKQTNDNMTDNGPYGCGNDISVAQFVKHKQTLAVKGYSYGVLLRVDDVTRQPGH